MRVTPRGVGRLTGINELNPVLVTIASTAYGYDQKGRVISDTRTINSVAYITGYRYDTSGRLDRIIYPSGRTVDFSLDSLGRISAVTTTPRTSGSSSTTSTRTGATLTAAREPDHPRGGAEITGR